MGLLLCCCRSWITGLLDKMRWIYLKTKVAVLSMVLPPLHINCYMLRKLKLKLRWWSIRRITTWFLKLTILYHISRLHRRIRDSHAIEHAVSKIINAASNVRKPKYSVIFELSTLKTGAFSVGKDESCISWFSGGKTSIVHTKIVK